MPEEKFVVTIEKVCAADPRVGFCLQLARDLKTGDGAVHYSVLKEYLGDHVGWFAKNALWWMKSEAAYDVTIEALCKALDGNPDSLGLASVGTNIAVRTT